MFFDPKNQKNPVVDINSFNYKKFTYDSDSIATSKSTPVNSVVEGILFSHSDTKSGYIMEIKFPWDALGVKPGNNLKLGFETNIIDNDNDTPYPGMISKKEVILAWYDDTYDNPFNKTDKYSTLVLKGN